MISEKDQIITIYSSLTAKSFVEEVMKLNLIKHCKDAGQKYMVKVDDNVIPEKTNINLDICSNCNNVLTLKTIDSVLCCEKCED